MTFSRRFYKAAAVCSGLSALTTLLLILLPRLFGPVADFESRMALVNNRAYVLRSWVYLLHPLVVLVAAFSVAASRRRAAAGAAAVGFLGFLLWAFTEAAQQALTLAAFDRWRAAYLVGDEAARAAIRAQVPVYDALWDAMYFLLLVGFLFGNVLYAVATWGGRGLARALSVFYFAGALFSLSYLSGELRGPTLPPLLHEWLYPFVQPAARLAIGVWLWRHADVADEPVTTPPTKELSL